MCIQPLVENALRHGVSRVEGRGEVRLSCAIDGDALTIEVSDNGPGFPRGFTLGASPGHALRNIDERLRGYYGEMGRLSWNAAAGLTRVSLRIPCQAMVESAARGKHDSYSDRGR
jgi:LytS/YehU family sensor histidine kinase